MKKLLLLFIAAMFAMAGFSQAASPPITNEAEVSATNVSAPAGIQKTEWKQVSGPASVTIVSPGSLKTLIKDFAVPGLYVFEFTVTDKVGQFKTVSVAGEVLPPFGAPEADAKGFIIRLPSKK